MFSTIPLADSSTEGPALTHENNGVGMLSVRNCDTYQRFVVCTRTTVVGCCKEKPPVLWRASFCLTALLLLAHCPLPLLADPSIHQNAWIDHEPMSLWAFGSTN